MIIFYTHGRGGDWIATGEKVTKDKRSEYASLITDDPETGMVMIAKHLQNVQLKTKLKETVFLQQALQILNFIIF